MKLTRQTILFFFILVAISTIVKIICAPQINLSGFTCVIAISLFAGLVVKDKKFAFLMPLLALFISDVILQILFAANLFPYGGFYKWQIVNYILFFIVTLVGMGLRNYKTAGIILAAFFGPTVFFLLSNFIVWKTEAIPMGYNTDISGLVQAYTMGLLFYRNSVISTFIFLPAFIALYNRIQYGRFTLMHAKN